jgi:hypothetical protein
MEKSKKESLERLKNQLFQAQAVGNTALAKIIQKIIDRIASPKRP